MKEIDVVCAIIINDDLIYCTQRGEGKELAFKWEFPGGKIEEGETMESALIREIKEELDCKITIENFFSKSSYKYNFGIVNLYAYICLLDDSVPVLSEHVNEKWIEKEDLKKLDWAAADIPIIDKLINTKVD